MRDVIEPRGRTFGFTPEPPHRSRDPAWAPPRSRAGGSACCGRRRILYCAAIRRMRDAYGTSIDLVLGWDADDPQAMWDDLGLYVGPPDQQPGLAWMHELMIGANALAARRARGGGLMLAPPLPGTSAWLLGRLDLPRAARAPQRDAPPGARGRREAGGAAAPGRVRHVVDGRRARRGRCRDAPPLSRVDLDGAQLRGGDVRRRRGARRSRASHLTGRGIPPIRLALSTRGRPPCWSTLIEGCGARVQEVVVGR